MAASWAAANGHKHVMEILLGPPWSATPAWDGVLDRKDKTRQTMLSTAAGSGHTEVVRLLLQRERDVCTEIENENDG